MIKIFYNEEWAIKEFEITLKTLSDGVSIAKSKITKLKKGRGRVIDRWRPGCFK